MSFAISGVNLELNHETCDRHEAGILRRSMHRKRGVPNSPRIVADAKETACTRVISSPYRITESAEILSRLNPLPNPALQGFQSVEIQARAFSGEVGTGSPQQMRSLGSAWRPPAKKHAVQQPDRERSEHAGEQDVRQEMAAHGDPRKPDGQPVNDRHDDGGGAIALR